MIESIKLNHFRGHSAFKQGSLAQHKSVKPELSCVDLDSNRIGSRGVKYLSRCLINNLEELCLGKSWNIQTKTRLKTLASRIWLKHLSQG